MKIGRALGAGIVGGTVVIALSAGAGWLLHYDEEIRAAVGRGFLVVIPWFGWVAIAAFVLFGAIALAIPYAFFFEFITEHAGAAIGAVVGLAHGAIVWLGIGMIAWLFPDVAQYAADELFILFDSIAAVSAFVVVHVVYGAVVGAIYGSPQRKAEVQTKVLWHELVPTEKTAE